jgi:hypothetical protein
LITDFSLLYHFVAQVAGFAEIARTACPELVEGFTFGRGRLIAPA